MNRLDDKSESPIFDFAVQLQVMGIILLFAALWWFESRGDKVEKRLERIEALQAKQPVETAVEIGKVIEPFLKDKESWKIAEPEIKKFREP